jgi:hypothetical protein
MLGWMLYATVVSALLAAAAWSAERSAGTRQAPARLYWSLAIIASVVLPIAIATVSIQLPSLGASNVGEAVDRAAVPLRQLTSEVLAPTRWLGAAPAAPGLQGVLMTGWAVVSGALALGILVQGVLLHRRKAQWQTARVAGVEVLVSETVGPAVVGLLQPRIVVPRWIATAAPEDQALIIAHERTHLDADDARLLAIAILLIVCMPWNLPLWWSLRRLRQAIEVDSDARVLRGGGEVKRYGEALLMVGARHSSNLAVVAAMSEPRSNLEQRLRRMLFRPTKFAWASGAGLAALSLVFAATAAVVSPPNRDGAPRLSAETLDRYVGVYDLDQSATLTVTRAGSQLLFRVTGQPDIPASPKTESEFIWGRETIAFIAGPKGKATAAVLRHDGLADQVMPRMTEGAASKFRDDLLARIERGQGAPGSQAALTHAVTAMMAGRPDYSQMEPSLAQRVREIGGYPAAMNSLGPVKSFAFSGVGPAGNDVYIASHAHGASRWSIGLSRSGKIRALQVSSWP